MAPAVVGVGRTVMSYDSLDAFPSRMGSRVCVDDSKRPHPGATTDQFARGSGRRAGCFASRRE